MSYQWPSDGSSSIWPEINSTFLSLRGFSDEFIPMNDTQRTYKKLLMGFDAITSCEMKELYKFKITLTQMNEHDLSLPELCLIHKAFSAWVKFDYDNARSLLTQHIRAYPSDIVALFFIHMLDFCTGKTTNLRSLLLYCDEHIVSTHYLYPYYLSIKSFVLCEAQCFDDALEVGFKSVKLMPDNIYGIHAVAHALHELGRWKELCHFLTNCKEHWITNAGMGMHVYWHLAIAYERSDEITLALQAFDELYALKDNPFAKQDLDAVEFLWQLRLKSADTNFQPIWERLAVLWTGSISSSTSYFHKIHAALAFSATNQSFLIEKLIAESDGFGIEPDTHSTGIDVLKAILLFTSRHYEECLNKLRLSYEKWPLLGGSRAQREILEQTMEYAALKASSTL
ncbi:tetratricopeptide repeat-containing protein [Photorhabdus luminescens]|uniref:tetratricopeptide repeat protein n=1 Tax=Photorhabdus aegyptia TaxID=2805098 RepID=UPI000CF8930D|nr:tetratricopeptide repeat protein [Photorhabdus aegyptia]MCC8457885.1 tetratricopeptide repeat protein [Photorhabdus aegyptia]PQQ31359.1 tetratricopeptide repeat-containing protein [Photorhabdus luminescens]